MEPAGPTQPRGMAGSDGSSNRCVKEARRLAVAVARWGRAPQWTPRWKRWPQPWVNHCRRRPAAKQARRSIRGQPARRLRHVG
jgi:hypothetical protein